MFIETVRTQAKLAVELHAQGCAANPAGHYPRDLDKCPNREMYIRRAAAMLGHLLPTIITEIVPAVRVDERGKILDKLADIHPLRYTNCPGGHECVCEQAALERVEEAIGAQSSELAPDPDRTDRWQVITDEIKRLSEEAGYGSV